MAIGSISCGGDYSLEIAQMMREYSMDAIRSGEQVAAQSAVQQAVQQIDISAEDDIAELIDIYA